MSPHKNFIIIQKNIEYDTYDIATYTTLLLDENENLLEKIRTKNQDDMLNAVASFERKYNLHDETTIKLIINYTNGEMFVYHKFMYEFMHDFIIYNSKNKKH